jgi:hypothetical protein
VRGDRDFDVHRRRFRRFVGFGYYDDYGYYPGGCGWLHRRAVITRSPYWWNRYYACINYSYWSRRAASVVGQPFVRDGNGIRRLAVHMSQRQAIGIDDTIAAGNRLKSPWSREAALLHAATISCAGRNGPLWGYGHRVGAHGVSCTGNRLSLAELRTRRTAQLSQGDWRLA